MNWAGEFVYGRTWAAFRGSAADNSFHSHATLQIAIAHGTPVTIQQFDAEAISGQCLLVKPNVTHQLHPTKLVTLIFVEPQTEFARKLLKGVDAEGVAALSKVPELMVDPSYSLIEGLAYLERTTMPSANIDARLASALIFLSKATGPRVISRAAVHAGISTARLRKLAVDQLGTPLTAWLAWRRMERAGIALSAGASLAEAAFDAGFADQAHLSRATRQMFGITPGTAGGVVRPQAKGSIQS